MKLILASKSPRRKQILKKFFDNFKIIPSNTSEITKIDDPVKHVLTNAKKKSYNIHKENEGVVIGADTVASYKAKILEKPEDDNDAKKMLKMMAGETHKVITGYQIINNNKKIINHVTTEVTFKKLSENEINDYISTEEPMDKAGSYAIQGKGSILVKKIKGDYYNVMGLPIQIIRKLRKFKINPLKPLNKKN